MIVLYIKKNIKNVKREAVVAQWQQRATVNAMFVVSILTWRYKIYFENLLLASYQKISFLSTQKKKANNPSINTYTIVPLQPDGALRAHAGVSAGEEVCGRRADCGLPVPLQHAHLPQGGAEGAGALGTRFFHYVGIV